jgi:hypothetical protein
MAWREQLTVGELTVEKPLRVKTYTLATAPLATSVPVGSMIFMSDATPPNLATSNGTIWLAADDGLLSA